MMRHMTAMSSGLALLFVAPGTILQNEDLRILELALEDTARAIEVVTGIQQEPAPSADLIKSVTEAPALDARGRDEKLQTLRDEVSLLQMEFDALQGLPVGHLGARPTGDTLRKSTSVPTGLTPEARAALLRLGSGTNTTVAPRKNARPAQGESTPNSPSKARPNAPKEQNPPSESEADPLSTYSADPVAAARACFYAKQYERGLQLLSGQTTDLQALYWKARILEKVEDYVGAIAALNEIIRLTGGEGYDAKRAETDKAFLEWKRDFLARVEASRKEGSR